MYNFIKNHFIKLLLLLLMTACESNQHPVPRCVPADVFTEGRTTSVSAYFDPTSENFMSDNKVLGNSVEDNQVVRWKYTGYVTNGHPIVLRAEGMWTSWAKKSNNVTEVQKNTTDYGDDDVDRYNAILAVDRVCGPYKKIEKTFSNGTNQCKVSCEMISGVQDNLETGTYGPPCWFRNGYGAYLLFKRPEDPEPNETITNMRYPTSPVMHIGYKPLELAGTHGISTSSKKIKDSSCKDVELKPGWKIYIKILDRNYYDNVGGYTVTFIDGIKAEQEFSAFEWVRKEVRGRLDKAGEDLFKNIVKNPVFKNFVFSLLTLFLIFGSLAYILGIVRTPFADIIVRLLKISLMLLLISPNSWDFFYNHLLRLFIHGTDQIIAMINSYTGDYNPQAPFSFMDIMIRDKIFSPVIWKIKIRALIVANFSSIFAVLVIVIAVLIYIALCIYGFVIYLTAFVGITFLVGLMPLLLLGILFSQFKSLFDGWLTQCISFSLQAILIFTLISLFGTLIMNYYYRIFGFTVCYNEWMKVKICLFGNVGCLVDKSLFGWTPGQIYDPKVIGITSDFNVSDKKASSDDPDDIKMSGNARYKFTGGGWYISVPPDHKHKDFRYIDYPFLDPDTESDSNPHGVNVAKDSKLKELSNLVNALLTTDKKYVVARLVADIKTELEKLVKNNTITSDSKDKVLKIINDRIDKDKGAGKSELDKYGDQGFKSEIIRSVIDNVIDGAAITPTSQEKLNEQYDYALIQGIRAGDLILWSEVGSLFLAALLIWQMRAFVQSVAVSLAGGSMMSQTIASMYEEGFLKTFSSIPVVGKVFKTIDGGLDSYKLLVGNYITETARRPLNMLQKVPVLGHAVKFTGKVAGGLTSSYGEYDRRHSSNFKQLNYARAFIGAHLGFSPLSAMKYLGGYAAGKMLGSRSGGLIHNMVQDRKAALDSLKAHILGPEQHKPSPYIPKQKEDDSNPFVKNDAKNLVGDSSSPGSKNYEGNVRGEPHSIARADTGNVRGDSYDTNYAGNVIGDAAVAKGYAGGVVGSSGPITRLELQNQHSLLDDAGNVRVGKDNLADALEAREQLKTMRENTKDETALININYDIDRLDSALHKHLGHDFEQVTQDYASSHMAVQHSSDLSATDYSRLNIDDISRLDGTAQISSASVPDTGQDILHSNAAAQSSMLDVGRDEISDFISASALKEETIPHEVIELNVLGTSSGQSLSSETGVHVQDEVQVDRSEAVTSPSDTTQPSALDVELSGDRVSEISSTGVSQGETSPEQQLSSEVGVYVQDGVQVERSEAVTSPSDTTQPSALDVELPGDGLSNISSTGVSQGETSPQSEEIELNVLGATPEQQLSSETGVHVQDEVQVDRSEAVTSPSDTTQPSALDVELSGDGLSDISSTGVSQGETSSQSEDLEAIFDQTLISENESYASTSDHDRESVASDENVLLGHENFDSLLDTDPLSHDTQESTDFIDEKSSNEFEESKELVDHKDTIESIPDVDHTSDAFGKELDVPQTSDQELIDMNAEGNSSVNVLSDQYQDTASELSSSESSDGTESRGSESDDQVLEPELQANTYYATDNEVLDVASLELGLPGVAVGNVEPAQEGSETKPEAVEVESNESEGVVSVTEEHSDSAASSESIDKESSEDSQLDQTSMEEQDKVGEFERDSNAEDTSIDKEVSGKPDIVEPVQEGSETKPEAVEVESNESEGVVSVTEEHSDSAASSESIEDGQLDQTSMEEQDKVGEFERDSNAEDTSVDKEVSGKPDIVEPAQEGSTKEESTSVLDEDSKRDVEESEEEGHDTSSDEGTEVDEVDSDGDDSADVEKGSNDTLENDLEAEESKVELTEELAVKDMPEESVTEGRGMKKASVVTDDMSEGLAAVHQVDSGKEFKLQEKMGLEGAQSIHIPKSLKSEEKDAVSKKSSTAKKTESTDSKDSAKEKKGTSTSSKTKKTSLPKIMSGVKILVNQYAKQISTGLSESFDKFFEDTESKKRGKRKRSKEDIESMVRDLEQLLVSLKDKKSKLTDPSEIANIEDDIRKLESTIKSILDNQ
ncbi:type IV secretion system protein [Ehrlichia ruminantium]|uniref:type IV secretion system protein n=1 Tax=Ehrlichia ruminantium TaxID=779 RepID=UPI001FB1F984|nr:type IV secretion system protein [Ehrlichia ruminantium]UOD98419.1 type IV secretion system protein [Ehrlichia ruminantium]